MTGRRLEVTTVNAVITAVKLFRLVLHEPGVRSRD
jgi:hypothetical protein